MSQNQLRLFNLFIYATIFILAICIFLIPEKISAADPIYDNNIAKIPSIVVPSLCTTGINCDGFKVTSLNTDVFGYEMWWKYFYSDGSYKDYCGVWYPNTAEHPGVCDYNNAVNDLAYWSGYRTNVSEYTFSEVIQDQSGKTITTVEVWPRTWKKITDQQYYSNWGQGAIFSVNNHNVNNYRPIGYLDWVNVNGNGLADGWAFDPDYPSESIEVHFYMDGPAGQGRLLGGVKANLPRPDVNQAGYLGDHGFNFIVPYEFRDGVTHTVYAYAIDPAGGNNSELVSSRKTYNILWQPQVYPNNGKLWMSSQSMETFDFKNLFTEPDKWEDARSFVGVFEFGDMYLNPNLNYYPDKPRDRIMNDAELKDAITKLKSWGIELSLAVGAVKEWGCTADKTFAVTQPAIDRILLLGGKIKYFDMDEPLVHMRAKPTGCGYTMDQIADQTIAYINLIKGLAPDAVVGDIEPWPYFNKETLKQWIIKFREKAGYEMPFFHLDINYAQAKMESQNLLDLKELADFSKSRGIKFGIIIWNAGYNYPFPLDSDKTYYDNSMGWAQIVHSLGPVDQSLVSSWDPYPKYNLPDSSGYSFTQLVKDYAIKYPPAILPVTPDLTPPSAPTGVIVE